MKLIDLYNITNTSELVSVYDENTDTTYRYDRCDRIQTFRYLYNMHRELFNKAVRCMDTDIIDGITVLHICVYRG